MKNFNSLYPKARTGKECKKTDCERHADYIAWKMGSDNLKFCMNCKNSHISQFKRIKD